MDVNSTGVFHGNSILIEAVSALFLQLRRYKNSGQSMKTILLGKQTLSRISIKYVLCKTLSLKIWKHLFQSFSTS